MGSPAGDEDDTIGYQLVLRKGLLLHNPPARAQVCKEDKKMLTSSLPYSLTASMPPPTPPHGPGDSSLTTRRTPQSMSSISFCQAWLPVLSAIPWSS
jgi:hypothetical protein